MAKAKKKVTRRKRGGDFGRTNKYSPRAELIETVYEDIEVKQADGSVTIQKNVPVHKYRTLSSIGSGTSIGTQNDVLSQLDSKNDNEDEEEVTD